MRYRVTAPYVTAKVPGGEVERSTTTVVVRGFHRGQLLPPGVPEDTISHLLKLDMIEEEEVTDG